MQPGELPERTLADALREFSDPERLAEYVRLQRSGNKRVVFRSEYIEGPQVAPGNRRAGETLRDRRRAQQLWRGLITSLGQRLAAGELVAIGLWSPASSPPELRFIEPHLWDVLDFDFGNSIARSSTTAFERVRIYTHAELKLLRDAFSPKRPAVVRSTASAETRCRGWIKEQAKTGKSWPSKKAMFEAARQEIGPGLSERAFKRVWKKYAPKRWKRPGLRRAT